MMKTKKVGSAGRFGARYGTKTKKVVTQIEKLQKRKHKCPECERSALKRAASGIWNCGKCGLQIGGGAYLPESVATKVIVESLKKKEK
ncbi:MAG: 50S ribosomal protein L37ae [Nanoarchaeota archaeon]|nr:50S ribosomal protein L37ae [bacterium]MBU3958082.1 50S ribosomal protein L37ae [Nanoarchaeota archaeon]